ncbi:hypothetical protein F9817_16665 [Vibrio sp. CAIM 722]|uniref:Uncharacterized protein n=1 Tax=Vibrio eleionomae TaxID=2653505 RepID=A0A7X4LN36_9VIBR|nr:hypothetical protein [Vibrio eleionomae]MZI94811.1 hypothetical protein [Vibrio eleionomae]
MDWIESEMAKYTKERDVMLRKRWYTLKSWVFRTCTRAKYDEMERLIKIEKEFNLQWKRRLRYVINQNSLTNIDINDAKTIIDTHKVKHSERDFYLILVGVIFVMTMKMFDSRDLFNISILLCAFFVGYERIFGSTTSSSVSEFKLLLESVEKDMQDHPSIINSPL